MRLTRTLNLYRSDPLQDEREKAVSYTVPKVQDAMRLATGKADGCPVQTTTRAYVGCDRVGKSVRTNKTR